MAKRSGTGIEGIRRGKYGRYLVDVRWTERATGRQRRYRESCPASAALGDAVLRQRILTEQAESGTFDSERARERVTRADEICRPERVRELLKLYLDSPSVRDLRSRKTRVEHVDKINLVIGNVRLDALSPRDVDRLIDARREAENSTATINRYLATLRHALLWACERGYASHDSVHGIRTTMSRQRRSALREPPGIVRWLKPDEETTLFTALGKHPALEALASVALHTGLRLGELVALTWADVDLGSDRIAVRRSKSGRSRFVDLNPVARRVVASLRPVEVKPGAPVFLTSEGAPWTSTGASNAFRRLVAKTNVQRFRFHDLRHTFATRLVMAGVAITTVAQLLGHSTILMTQRYAHVSDEMKRDAVRRLVATTVPGIPANDVAA